MSSYKIKFAGLALPPTPNSDPGTLVPLRQAKKSPTLSEGKSTASEPILPSWSSSAKPSKGTEKARLTRPRPKSGRVDPQPEPTLPQRPEEESRKTLIRSWGEDIDPRKCLAFAGKHSVRAIASKEGVGEWMIQERINDAAYKVAALDNKCIMDVLYELELSRLHNRIHQSRKAMVSALNKRAAREFPEFRASALGSDRKSVPCHSGRRCKKHTFCIVQDQQKKAKEAFQAEQEAKKARRDDDEPQQ